jgi:3-methyladenine DNA glycosylase AlkD
MRAVNIKHGAGENHFGVNLSKLRALAKKLKTNHPLALELWGTGNVDAMLLALLIVDPKQLTAKGVDAMMKKVSYFKIADWLVSYVLPKTKLAAELLGRWRDSESECLGRAGWSLMADKVKEDPATVEEALRTIETEMKQAPFRKQESMNYCLVMIGATYPEHRQRAIDIANRLEVLKDYPVPKGCTSPFAPVWIAYLVERQK